MSAPLNDLKKRFEEIDKLPISEEDKEILKARAVVDSGFLIQKNSSFSPFAQILLMLPGPGSPVTPSISTRVTEMVGTDRNGLPFAHNRTDTALALRDSDEAKARNAFDEMAKDMFDIIKADHEKSTDQFGQVFSDVFGQDRAATQPLVGMGRAYREAIWSELKKNPDFSLEDLKKATDETGKPISEKFDIAFDHMRDAVNKDTPGNTKAAWDIAQTRGVLDRAKHLANLGRKPKPDSKLDPASSGPSTVPRGPGSGQGG